MYIPIPVPQNKQTINKWELQVEKALYLLQDDEILRMEQWFYSKRKDP